MILIGPLSEKKDCSLGVTAGHEITQDFCFSSKRT